MFGGAAMGAGELSSALAQAASQDGPVITPASEMGIVPPTSQSLPLQPTSSPIVSVLTAPMKLAKQLGVMREELVSRVNEGELKRAVEGFSFDQFEEKAVAVRYVGVRLYDRQFPEDDARREPYTKICRDFARVYELPEDVLQNMLNAALALAKEAHQFHYEFKFSKGAPGHFYFGKFMAVNSGGEIDMILLFYRMGFQISPDDIVTEHAHKFLWWTTHTTYTTELREIVLSEHEKNNFQDYFLLKMYKELSDQIRAFELEDQ